MEALREAHEILPKDADPKLRARVLEMLARRTTLSGDVQQGIEFSQQAVEAAASLTPTRSRRTRGSHSAPAWLPPAKRQKGSPRSSESATSRNNTRTLLRFHINYSDALNHVGRYDDAARQALAVSTSRVNLVWNAPRCRAPGMPPNPSRAGVDAGVGHDRAGAGTGSASAPSCSPAAAPGLAARVAWPARRGGCSVAGFDRR